MSRLRLTLLTLGASAVALVGWSIPAGAGQGTALLEGVAACANGQYTITWTVTLSGAATGTVTFTPNPVPGPSPAVSHAQSVHPGTTVGDVTLTLTSDYIIP